MAFPNEEEVKINALFLILAKLQEVNICFHGLNNARSLSSVKIENKNTLPLLLYISSSWNSSAIYTVEQCKMKPARNTFASGKTSLRHLLTIKKSVGKDSKSSIV